MKKYIKVKLVISLLLGISILYFILKKFLKVTGTNCFIRGIFGIPCPSCGISRAIIAFLNRDFGMAFKYHPLFWVPTVVLVVSIINKKYLKKLLLVFITIFIVVYIIRMLMFFPDTEPMKYNEKSIFNQLRVKEFYP